MVTGVRVRVHSQAQASCHLSQMAEDVLIVQSLPQGVLLPGLGFSSLRSEEVAVLRPRHRAGLPPCVYEMPSHQRRLQTVRPSPCCLSLRSAGISPFSAVR